MLLTREEGLLSKKHIEGVFYTGFCIIYGIS